MNLNAAMRQCTPDITVRADLINKEEKLLAVEKFLVQHFSKNKSKKSKVA
jgi:hypothetical protein